MAVMLIANMKQALYATLWAPKQNEKKYEETEEELHQEPEMTVILWTETDAAQLERSKLDLLVPVELCLLEIFVKRSVEMG
jgi:hypothetical protein